MGGGYQVTQRGVYENVRRGRQLLRFDGIQWGNITPTDIDSCTEFHDSVWVMCEVKTRNKDLPFGQRLLLERFVRDTTKAGKHSIAIIAEHDVDDPRKDVSLKRNCMVREFFATETMKWRPPNRPMSAEDMMSTYIHRYGKEYG